jgi:hypothetical protein
VHEGLLEIEASDFKEQFPALYRVNAWNTQHYAGGEIDLEKDESKVLAKMDELKKYCATINELACSPTKKQTKFKEKSVLLTVGKLLKSIYENAMEVKQDNVASALAEQLAIERFQDILKASPNSITPSDKCECSGSDMFNAHHPMFNRLHYVPRGSEVSEASTTKARTQGWKIEVYLTCCVNAEHLSTIVNGLSIQQLAVNQIAVPERDDLSLCKCEPITKT